MKHRSNFKGPIKLDDIIRVGVELILIRGKNCSVVR